MADRHDPVSSTLSSGDLEQLLVGRGSRDESFAPREMVRPRSPTRAESRATGS